MGGNVSNEEIAQIVEASVHGVSSILLFAIGVWAGGSVFGIVDIANRTKKATFRATMFLMAIAAFLYSMALFFLFENYGVSVRSDGENSEWGRFIGISLFLVFLTLAFCMYAFLEKGICILSALFVLVFGAGLIFASLSVNTPGWTISLIFAGVALIISGVSAFFGVIFSTSFPGV